MIITIFREEYLALIDSHRYRHWLHCCTARFIQMFRWLSKNGLSAVQLVNEEIRLTLLDESVLDAMPQGGFAEGIADRAGGGATR